MTPTASRLATVVTIGAVTAFGAETFVAAATVAAPPRLAPEIPVEIVLVLDASRSVRYGSGEADSSVLVHDVVAVAQSVLAGVADGAGSAARAAVVSYDEDARVQLTLTPVTSDTLANGGVFDEALGDPGDVTGPLKPTTGYTEHSRRGLGSNWEAGLAASERLLSASRENAARLVVHVTDGEPTAHLNADGEPTVSDDPEEDVASGALTATRLKDGGVRVLVVGVGQARSRLAALVRVSGPDVYDQRRNEMFDPRAHDVILFADPGPLVPLFAEVVRALAPTPPDVHPPAVSAEPAGEAGVRSWQSWPQLAAAGSVFLLLVVLIIAAVSGRRRRRQLFGIGAVARRRRRAIG